MQFRKTLRSAGPTTNKPALGAAVAVLCLRLREERGSVENMLYPVLYVVVTLLSVEGGKHVASLIFFYLLLLLFPGGLFVHCESRELFDCTEWHPDHTSDEGDGSDRTRMRRGLEFINTCSICWSNCALVVAVLLPPTSLFADSDHTRIEWTCRHSHTYLREQVLPSTANRHTCCLLPLAARWRGSRLGQHAIESAFYD